LNYSKVSKLRPVAVRRVPDCDRPYQGECALALLSFYIRAIMLAILSDDFSLVMKHIPSMLQYR
jgi:hypothetical protein